MSIDEFIENPSDYQSKARVAIFAMFALAVGVGYGFYDSNRIVRRQNDGIYCAERVLSAKESEPFELSKLEKAYNYTFTDGPNEELNCREVLDHFAAEYNQ